MPELSVIVPVYRAEKFLDQCVKSILNQTFSDLELILVEDGSPDCSGALCDCLAEKDPRIRVIHQKNAGVSAARNRGLSMAEGDYVGFVDSDDWIAPHMYASLLEDVCSSNGEIACCDGMYVREDGTRKEDSLSGLAADCVLNRRDLTPDLLIELACSACYRIYRKEFLQEHEIEFPVGLKISEDRIFNLYAMGYASRISYRKEPLYMRRVNPESCVQSYHGDRFACVQQAQCRMEQAIQTAWNGDTALLSRFLDLYVDGAQLAIGDFRHPDCPLSLIKRLKNIRRICEDQKLRRAIDSFGYGYEMGQLMLRRKAVSIYYMDTPLYRKLSNFQETFADGGLRGVFRKIQEKIMKKS